MSNLDKFKEAIAKAKENKGRQEGLQFEFEGVEPGSWNDFLIKTDIGQIIAQNQQVNFKDSYGRRTRGAFIKIDENTFAQVSLLGSGRSDNSYVGITFFSREELESRTEILIDYDDPNYMKNLQESRKALLEFEDFSFDDRSKEKLVDKLRNIKINGSNEILSDRDVDLAFEMISNGELTWDWLGNNILSTAQFKNNLINFIINESPKNGRCGRFIEDLLTMDDGDFLDRRNYFFDENILKNKEFIDNLNKKYFNGENNNGYRNNESKYESGTEAITFAIFSKYSKDGSFKNPDFLEEKIKFIAERVEENDGDLGFIKGIIPYVLEYNPEYIDKILNISSDREVISKILETAPSSAFENPEFLKKILSATTDEKLIGRVLRKMSVEDKINPEIMLGIIEVCPNVLEVFEENYDKWDLNKKNPERNVYYALTKNEEFQKGLLDMCQRLIQESQIEEHHIGESYRPRRGRTYQGEYTPAHTLYKFNPDSPMGKFEEKISYTSREILVDITSRYYEEQQKQLGNSQFDSHDIFDIKYKATRSGGNFAYAVKKAEEIKQRHLEEQGKTGSIKPATAARNALKGTSATKADEAKGVEQTALNPENIKEGETKDD